MRRVRLALIGLTANMMLVSLLLLSLPTAGAAMANLSHSYHSTTTLNPGVIVSVQTSKADYVEPSNTTNGQQTVGVVVKSSDSLLAVNADDNLTQVATTGTVSVAVSDLNGAIKAGDQVAVSPFNGIGMKAIADSGEYIVGVAQSALSTTAANTSEQTVSSKQGTNKVVHIGYVQINISPGNASPSAGGAADLNGLQMFVKTLTGKVIPTPRIVIALSVASATILILVALIYGAIYSAIISIGRNPLAKYAVFRTLGGVIVVSLVLGAISVTVILFLLH